jgi:two-component system nitrogen regulation response regulator GlnG
MFGENSPAPIVLVVDDEALIRWALSEGLTELGYPVRLAATGSEARAAVAACGQLPLVVLLDLRLPDVRDLSLLQEIRAMRPDAPVLMMTAHGAAAEAAEAERLGAYRFLGKPFDVGEMVRLVGEAWQNRPNTLPN